MENLYGIARRDDKSDSFHGEASIIGANRAIFLSIYKRAHGCVAGRRIVQRFVLLATRLLVTCN